MPTAFSASSGLITLGAGTTLQTLTTSFDNNGIIEGSGTFDGTILRNFGFLRPGGSSATGTLFVTGALETQTGTIDSQLSSVSVYDKVITTGNITTLAGSELILVGNNGTRLRLAGNRFEALPSPDGRPLGAAAFGKDGWVLAGWGGLTRESTRPGAGGKHHE